ncbi:MAG: restriction endonuclease subunit S [Oscillospiraceae bacterium]|nr:restriction endonuclease subunit S [Oscillospiraceae bacterium]
MCLADEVPFDIPDSWEWTRLGQVIILLSGTDFKPSEYNDRQCGIPYITGASSLSDSGVIENRWTETPRVIANRGDVLLVCKGSGYGKTVICDIEEAHIARQIMAIKNQHTLNMDYVRFFLQSCFDQIKAKGQGVIPGIDRSSVLSLLFPLPPLHEQKRIVAKLFEVIPIVDVYGTKERTLYEHNAEFPVQLKKSILQCAVQGRLVPQDPNDEPASILLERIRTEKQRLVKEGKIKKDKHESVIFRRDNSHYEKVGLEETCIDNELPFEIPDTWSWVRFADIAIFENGDRSNKYPIEADYVSDGIPFFGAKDMGDKYMEFSTVRFITQEKFAQLGNGKLQNGDLVCLLRGSVGKTRIFKESEKYTTGFICAQMMIIRCLDLNILDYLYALINSPYYCKAIESKITGTAVRQLPAREVANILIPLPPLNEQFRIIEKLSELFVELQTL